MRTLYLGSFFLGGCWYVPSFSLAVFFDFMLANRI